MRPSWSTAGRIRPPFDCGNGYSWMKVTTVTSDMAVGSLLTAGVLPGPVAVGGELVAPHAARNNARRSRRHKQHIRDKRFKMVGATIKAIHFKWGDGCRHRTGDHKGPPLASSPRF